MAADTILLLMGESGSGKTTIADILEECHDLKQLKSYTTRPKRYPTENNHTFVSIEQFKKLTNFVAYTYFDGNYYGATEEQVQNCNVYIIDPDGIEYFMEHYSGTKEPIIIYLHVPCKERYERMLQRGDSPESAAIRIKHDFSAFQQAESMADYVIENIDVQQTVSDILKIIRR